MDLFTSKKHQEFSRSKIWEHISKARKVMVNAFTKSLPTPFLNCSTQAFGGPWALNPINDGFSYARAHKLFRKGIQCVDGIWDGGICTSLSWDEAQVKFKLT